MSVTSRRIQRVRIRSFHAPAALLPNGWAEDVAIDVDTNGYITAVHPDSPIADDATRLAGPTLPGIVNAHSHTFQRAMAGLAESTAGYNDSFWTWRKRMYSLVLRLSPEQIGVIARYTAIGMLKSGYTGLVEFHYLHHDNDGRPYSNKSELAGQVLAAAKNVGLPITLLPTLYTYSNFGGRAPTAGQRRFVNDVDGFIALIEAIRPQLAQHQQAGIAFHSLRAVEPAQIQAVRDALPDAGPIHIHIAEQQREVDDCLAWSNRRPVEWLLDNIEIDKRWCLIHATHLSDAELTELAASDASVGLCPTTEASLGDGIFRGSDFITHGGCFAVGSDSQVSLSPGAELRMLEYGQRLTSEKRNRLHEGGEVGSYLYQTTAQTGAQAAIQPTGALQEGRRADFVVLDGNEPMLAGCRADQIASCWLFAGTDDWIRDIWIAGQHIVTDRRHPDEVEAARAMASVMLELAS